MFEDFKSKFKIEKENTVLPCIKEFYINKNDIKQVLEYLKTSNFTMFNSLDCVFAKDNGSFFTLTYILNSSIYNTKCLLSCEISYDNAQIISVESIYKSADFDEREIFDLFGINFINRPCLKRILLPADFKGHPLRKDYEMKDERLCWNCE